MSGYGPGSRRGRGVLPSERHGWRESHERASNRTRVIGVLLCAAATTFVLGSGAFADSHHAPTPAASAGQTFSAPAAVTAEAPPTTALQVLDTLPVKGRAPMTGYQRTERFGAAWLDVDRNGCDTRDDVLRRDLEQVQHTRCKVLSGILHDPYTKQVIDFRRGRKTSAAVQIDHVVALGAAWRTGAQQLSKQRRVALANDPINLFAVDGETNQQKSDKDAASWLPPNKAFRCTYAAHQVGVKKAYGLWVTKAERATLLKVLTRCPDRSAPVSTLAGSAAADARR